MTFRDSNCCYCFTSMVIITLFFMIEPFNDLARLAIGSMKPHAGRRLQGEENRQEKRIGNARLRRSRLKSTKLSTWAGFPHLAANPLAAKWQARNEIGERYSVEAQVNDEKKKNCDVAFWEGKSRTSLTSNFFGVRKLK